MKMPNNEKENRGKINGHVIFFLVFAILLIIMVIRLAIWNRGQRTDYDPNENTTEFDVELLDYVQPLDPAVLKGREDDGVTTILALGNDPLADDRTENGLAALIEKESGAVIYNCAFPGSTIAMKNAEYNSNYPLDGLSLYWSAAALCNQNFDLMEAVVRDLNSESANEALKTIKSVDLTKVDALVIMYDLQDYMGRRIVYDENNHRNLNTVYGALNATIQLFQEEYPYIRIYMLSPTYGTFTEGDGTTYDCDRDDLGNGTLVDYINWELEACRSNGITFIDNYYGAVSMDHPDCLTDGFHLNQEGRQRVADRFMDVFAPSD
ncbi:MAG: hypothetical protein Q4C58_13220 [Eubacteriales bacterium]|nr:hypothetical protein [Eubacteriales bacterium]